MKGHTQKIRIHTECGYVRDAVVYTSGGSTFTVKVEDIETGERTFRSFRGANAKARAMDYATESAK